MIVRGLLVWLMLMAAAIANGAFREEVLVPATGEGAAHVISTLLLCLLIVAISLATVAWIRPASRGDATRLGLLWLVLVLVFEFGFGRVVVGNSWGELFADYDILAGRVRLAVPVVTACAPRWAARIRGLI